MILTPLLIIAGLLAGVALTITSFYFLLAIFRPALHQLPLSPPPKSAAEQLKKVLRTIPVLHHPKNENQSECSVCLSSVVEGDKVRVLPDCGHAFHALCIDAWLCSKLSCPFCRTPVRAPANSPGKKTVEPSRTTLLNVKEAFLQNNGGSEFEGAEREEGSPV